MSKTQLLLLFLFSLCGLSLAAAEEGKSEVMTLEDCIAYALVHSPELKNLDLDAEIALLATLIERYRFDPSISLSNNYDTDDERLSQSVTLTKPFLRDISVSTTGSRVVDSGTGDDSASLSVKVSKTILGGGSLTETEDAIEDSLLDQTIAANRLAKARRRVERQVRSAFYQILRNSQSLSVQERRLERALRNYEHAEVREKPLDIITAKIEIPESENAVLRAERTIEEGLDRLKEIIGMPIEDKLELELGLDFSLRKLSLAGDLKHAIDTDEDLLNNRLDREKLDRQLFIREEDTLPEVTVSAEHRLRSETDRQNLSGDSDQLLSLNVSWDIGSRLNLAQLSQERNRVRKNENSYFSLRQAKVKRVYELHRQLLELEKSIALQEERIKLLEFQVELFRDRWENGEIGILELVRSENNREDSLVQLINLQSQYLDRVADYDFEVVK